MFLQRDAGSRGARCGKEHRRASGTVRHDFVHAQVPSDEPVTDEVGLHVWITPAASSGAEVTPLTKLLVD